MKNVRFSANLKREAKKEEIIIRMENGQRFEAACKSSGIDPRTGRRWRKRDMDFARAVVWLRFMRRERPNMERLIRRSNRLLAEGSYLMEQKDRDRLDGGI